MKKSLLMVCLLAIAVPAVADSAAQQGEVRVHVDPKTGKIVPAPGGESQEKSAPAAATEPVLKEQRGRSAAGGVKVNVRGLYRAHAVAASTNGESPSIQCTTEQAPR